MPTALKSDPKNEEQRAWLWASFKPRYFPRRHKLRDAHTRWRRVAELLRLSRAARGRLEWIIFWEKNGKDVSLTARHFGISRKTFYKWSARFDKEFLRGLEDESRTPRRRRRRQYTARQYERGGAPPKAAPALRQDEAPGAVSEATRRRPQHLCLENPVYYSRIGSVLRA